MKRKLRLIKVGFAVILATVMVVGNGVAPNVYANTPQPKITGVSEKNIAIINNCKITIDGGEVITIPAYMVNGNNYVRARDLCKVLDINVDILYDGPNPQTAQQVVSIEATPYVNEGEGNLGSLTKNNVAVDIKPTLISFNNEIPQEISGFNLDNRMYYKLRDLSNTSVESINPEINNAIEIISGLVTFTLDYNEKTNIVGIYVKNNDNSGLRDNKPTTSPQQPVNPATPTPKPSVPTQPTTTPSTTVESSNTGETGMEYLKGDYTIDTNKWYVGDMVYSDGSRIVNLNTSYGNHSFSSVKDLDDQGFGTIDGIKVRRRISEWTTLNDKGTVIAYDTIEKDKNNAGTTIKEINLSKVQNFDYVLYKGGTGVLTSAPKEGEYLAKVLIDESKPYFMPGDIASGDSERLTLPYVMASNPQTCAGYADGRFREVNGYSPGSFSQNATNMNLDKTKADWVTDVNAVVAGSIIIYDGEHVAFVEYVERDANGKPLLVYYTDSGVEPYYAVNRNREDMKDITNGIVCVTTTESIKGGFGGKFAGYIVPKK